MVKILVLLCCFSVTSAEKTRTHPLVVDMQGVWEARTKMGNADIRIVKTIGRDSETVEYFRGDQLLQRHQVEYEVGDEGPVTVFRWKNGRHLFGPRRGQPVADGTAVVRLVGKRLVFVEGMLNGDSKAISVLTFHRRNG